LKAERDGLRRNVYDWRMRMVDFEKQAIRWVEAEHAEVWLAHERTRGSEGNGLAAFELQTVRKED
jgi:hypothetical protein